MLTIAPEITLDNNMIYASYHAYICGSEELQNSGGNDESYYI